MTDKLVASEFAASTKSTLPIIGVDLAPSILAQMTLDTAWLIDDEAWRLLLTPFSTADRRYLESIKEAVVDGKGKAEGDGWVWLFSVRDAKVSLIFFFQVILTSARVSCCNQTGGKDVRS